MTTTDYLIDAALVLMVLRQAHERPVDRRSVTVPLILMGVAAAQYLHALPTAGDDLALIGALAALGLVLGLLGGWATQVRVEAGGAALVRVGWLAGALLLAGIGARTGFVLAVEHGLGPAVRSFSVQHRIGAAAWPVALVSMAMTEVAVRIAVVQVRGRRMLAA